MQTGYIVKFNVQHPTYTEECITRVDCVPEGEEVEVLEAETMAHRLTEEYLSGPQPSGMKTILERYVPKRWSTSDYVNSFDEIKHGDELRVGDQTFIVEAIDYLDHSVTCGGVKVYPDDFIHDGRVTIVSRSPLELWYNEFLGGVNTYEFLVDVIKTFSWMETVCDRTI